MGIVKIHTQAESSIFYMKPTPHKNAGKKSHPGFPPAFFIIREVTY